MLRRQFITKLGGATAAICLPMSILNELSKTPDDQILPALFIGHGSPMNAIEDNEFSRGWSEIAKKLPKPRAVLCISAHWETSGTRVCAVETPRTIHDFMGFPRALHEMQYPAPGAPEYAQMTASQIKKTHVELDHEWGLDHGSWSVLCRMFPMANVPVYQLSLDQTKSPRWHYELAKELRSLRRKGVLIVGSGNMVHNLRLMQFQAGAFEWASEFDMRLKKLIAEGDHDSVINYRKHGTMADLSVPTNEHYLPLLYVLGLQEKNEPLNFFNEKTTMGSISMRSLVIGS
jgi:4,5-DOPA dioxygenase extradiol